MLTETHRGAVIMNPVDDGIRWGAESIVKQTVLEANAHGDTRRAIDNDDRFRWSAESIVKQTVLEGHAHGDTRPAMNNDDGFRWNAESIVKQTVLEAHAHGNTPGRSHNESEGQNWQIFGVLTTTKNNTRNGPNRTIWDHFWVGQRGGPFEPHFVHFS